MLGSPLALVGCVGGESVIKSVRSRPVVSTRLKAPGDMEENMVSNMSKFSSPPCVEIELSRHVLNSGSFISNRLLVCAVAGVGEKVDNGAVEVDEGIVVLNEPVMEGDV